jgi:hypothetical protein
MRSRDKLDIYLARGDKKHTKNFGGKHFMKRSLRIKRRREDNTKMDLMKTGFEECKQMNPVQNCANLRNLVSAVLNFV